MENAFRNSRRPRSATADDRCPACVGDGNMADYRIARRRSVKWNRRKRFAGAAPAAAVNEACALRSAGRHGGSSREVADSDVARLSGGRWTPRISVRARAAVVLDGRARLLERATMAL